MDDVLKLLQLAAKLDLPDVAATFLNGIARMKDAADQAAHVLTAGEAADMEAIHARATAINAELDIAAAQAERE